MVGAYGQSCSAVSVSNRNMYRRDFVEPNWSVVCRFGRCQVNTKNFIFGTKSVNNICSVQDQPTSAQTSPRAVRWRAKILGLVKKL